jgi:hypothetical protein
MANWHMKVELNAEKLAASELRVELSIAQEELARALRREASAEKRADAEAALADM